ncbi:PREDICTED: protein NATD1-like [Amphimedon queenslandica]|uniref:Protein NATD1 n=1 Tax=Amphimedon queenslandica TaxID=400682 RepID=A0A1X7TKR6_AMPQE|nr:PREDICTED: protein NATD1-like [Amphimedon queenslandica]|eukprot:XP_003390309.1 PREDICTED: protein NATD1-like [Amphimedon queenslandica]
MAGVQATHSPSLRKFSIVIDEEEAVLLYRDEGGNTWDAYHTEVPPSQRGKGLGAVLAQALFAHVSNNNLRIRVSCTYLQHYVTKHPELNKYCVS